MSINDESSGSDSSGDGGRTRVLASKDGESVALHDFGGEGPTLLLGHGNGLNAGMWAGALPHLRPHYRCYGIDLRGHGACPEANTSYSVERNRFAEDVLRCVDEVGGPVLYAGHSLGGASAIYAALMRPEAFVALWLFEPVMVPDTFVYPGGNRPTFLIDASRRRRMEFDSVDDAFERFSSKPPYSDCDPISVRSYVEIGTRPISGGGVRLTCEGENEARVFESGQPLDFARLSAVTMPTVVAAGGDGDGPNAIPAQVAPLVADALGNCRLEEHATLSHFGPMEDPATIAKSIVDHFSNL